MGHKDGSSYVPAVRGVGEETAIKQRVMILDDLGDDRSLGQGLRDPKGGQIISPGEDARRKFGQ